MPEALKREIVAASFAPGDSVSVVARRYDVNTNQVFAWRKRFAITPSASQAPQLVPLVLTLDQVDVAPRCPPADSIEIELASRHRVRIGCGVKPAFLRLVQRTSLRLVGGTGMEVAASL